MSGRWEAAACTWSHQVGALLLSFGVNPRVVMEIVGHSAMEMTMNVYGHVTLDN